MYSLLALLFAINVASVAGYAIFTLNPINLVNNPFALKVFAVSYPLFARAQVAVAALCFGYALWRVARWRWLGAFAAVVVIALASELGGTSVGIPFGKYEYTSLLGPKLFGKVPFLVPLSWFFMSVPSFDFAERLLGSRSPLLARLGLAASFLLVWDVSLDPAMSRLTPFWAWEKPGFYYGAPLTNMTGWFMTGVALMYALHRTHALTWIRRLPASFTPLFYLVNLSLPVGMVFFAGLWPAFAVSTSAVLVTGYVYLRTTGWSVRRPSQNAAEGLAGSV